MPKLLTDRPLPLQFVLVVVGPAALGGIAGWLLGVSKIAYIVISVVAAIGGYLAGLEQDRVWQGALRGVVGGAIFGGAILAVHDATGKAAKVNLPDPKIALVAITAVAGLVLGAMGASRRSNYVEEEEAGPAFDIRRIHRSELLGFLGSAILLGSLWLNWFSTSCTSRGVPQGCNVHSQIAGKYGAFSAWQTYSVLDWLLVAACVAPFILAYIIARGHELSWRPGEVTMIVGILVMALILLNGVILGKPGSNIEISFEIGYLVGLVGGFLIFLGGFLRQASAIRSRKPPGVL